MRGPGPAGLVAPRLVARDVHECVVALLEPLGVGRVDDEDDAVAQAVVAGPHVAERPLAAQVPELEVDRVAGLALRQVPYGGDVLPHRREYALGLEDLRGVSLAGLFLLARPGVHELQVLEQRRLSRVVQPQDEDVVLLPSREPIIEGRRQVEHGLSAVFLFSVASTAVACAMPAVLFAYILRLQPGPGDCTSSVVLSSVLFFV